MGFPFFRKAFSNQKDKKVGKSKRHKKVVLLKFYFLVNIECFVCSFCAILLAEMAENRPFLETCQIFTVGKKCGKKLEWSQKLEINGILEIPFFRVGSRLKFLLYHACSTAFCGQMRVSSILGIQSLRDSYDQTSAIFCFMVAFIWTLSKITDNNKSYWFKSLANGSDSKLISNSIV